MCSQRNYKNDWQKKCIGRLIGRSNSQSRADNDRSLDRLLLRFAVVLVVTRIARAAIQNLTVWNSYSHSSFTLIIDSFNIFSLQPECIKRESIVYLYFYYYFDSRAVQEAFELTLKGHSSIHKEHTGSNGPERFQLLLIRLKFSFSGRKKF